MYVLCSSRRRSFQMPRYSWRVRDCYRCFKKRGRSPQGQTRVISFAPTEGYFVSVILIRQVCTEYGGAFFFFTVDLIVASPLVGQSYLRSTSHLVLVREPRFILLAHFLLSSALLLVAPAGTVLRLPIPKTWFTYPVGLEKKNQCSSLGRGPTCFCRSCKKKNRRGRDQ